MSRILIARRWMAEHHPRHLKGIRGISAHKNNRHETHNRNL